MDTGKSTKPALTEEKPSVLKMITKFLRRQLPYNRQVYSAEERTDFAHVVTFSFVETKYSPGRVISEWINEHMSNGLLVNDTLLSRHGDGIPASEWEDPRIRPLVLEDTLRNDLYMEIDCYRRAVEALLQVRHAPWPEVIISIFNLYAGPQARLFEQIGRLQWHTQLL